MMAPFSDEIISVSLTLLATCAYPEAPVLLSTSLQASFFFVMMYVEKEDLKPGVL